MIGATAEFKEALKAPTVNYCVMASIETDSGIAYLWSGYGKLNYAGEEWIGIGQLGGIGNIDNSVELQISELTFFLTNVPNDELGLIDENPKGKKAQLYWALLDDNLNVIPDPIFLFEMDLDVYAVKADDSGTNALYLTGQAGFWVLEQVPGISWSVEEQKKIFPDDRGFDLVESMGNKEVAWGDGETSH